MRKFILLKLINTFRRELDVEAKVIGGIITMRVTLFGKTILNKNTEI
jgi:hypothetical protein